MGIREKNKLVLIMSRLLKLIFFGSFVIGSSLRLEADQTGLFATFPTPDLERGYLLAEYQYFSESLDVLDYASKINSTFKPIDASTLNLAVGFKVFDRALIGYQREASKGELARDREPYSLKSELEGDSLYFRYQAGEWFNHTLFFSLSAAQREQSKLEVDCYEYASLILGRCASADFTLVSPETGEGLPVFTTSAEESHWIIQFSAEKSWGNGWSLIHNLSFKSAEVEIKTNSALFDIDSPFLLNAEFGGQKLGAVIGQFRDALPQSAPWRERVIRYDLGANWAISDNWIATTRLSFLKVTRSQYLLAEGEPSYESNSLLNAALWFTPRPGLAWYFKGEVAQHYTLGIDALTYNRRTARFFEHPYGQLKFGLLVSI